MNVRCTFVDGRSFEVAEGETLLKACRRSAVSIPFSCGAGSCHACLLRAVDGEVPARAQRGLKPHLVAGRFLLACQCIPVGPLTLALPQPQDLAEPEAAESPPPAPDPQLWHELGKGRTARAVLEDFYGRVYEDERLAPFFHGVTRERAIDKQYSFLRQLMTGERVYFGDRPRNAHHWMVIPDDLFDHRQALMARVLAAHGLSPAQQARWQRLEEHYRRDIVKRSAWPRLVDGEPQPLEGYASEVLTEGTVCDHCGEGIGAGTAVDYHVRLGTVTCGACSASRREAHA